MLYEVTTSKTLDEIETGLREAAARHKFGIMTVHNLKATMAKKGVEFGGECMIYEVCNPHQAKKVLEENGAVSTALPCRISAYEKGGERRVATLLPTALIGMFGSPSLEPVAREVEDSIKAIMDEAVR
jgi:uncharacterized protein (DUF302 family)